MATLADKVRITTTIDCCANVRKSSTDHLSVGRFVQYGLPFLFGMSSYLRLLPLLLRSVSSTRIFCFPHIDFPYSYMQHYLYIVSICIIIAYTNSKIVICSERQSNSLFRFSFLQPLNHFLFVFRAIKLWRTPLLLLCCFGYCAKGQKASALHSEQSNPKKETSLPLVDLIFWFATCSFEVNTFSRPGNKRNVA